MLIYVKNTGELIYATEGFQYDLDSHKSGTLTWRLNNLPTGNNTVVVYAFDSFNNMSTAETSFVTMTKDPISINNLLVYPNPMKQNGGYFTFDLNFDSDITITIYTITGRKIKTIKENSCISGFNKIFWDGRDTDGHKIANNTYFYTIKASNSTGGNTERKEKFIMLR
jgi:hypothetical protein